MALSSSASICVVSRVRELDGNATLVGQFNGLRPYKSVNLGMLGVKPNGSVSSSGNSHICSEHFFNIFFSSVSKN